MDNENKNLTDTADIYGNSEAAGILLPVPALAKNTRPPAFISTIELILTGTDEETVRFVIKRDLSLKLKSFTLRYRFSSLPIYAPDDSHIFRQFVYDGDDINTESAIELNAAVSSAMTSSGCSAYISEVTLESGQLLSWDAAEYKYVKRPRQVTHIINESAKDAEYTAGATDTPAVPTEATASEPGVPANPNRRKRITAILCAMLLIFAAEAVGGVFLSRYLGVKNSTDMLMKDKRYNEAYKIALDSGYESLLQRVCEKASTYFYSQGDLESAFVYAYGAPDRFTDTVIEYAAGSVVSMLTGEINENAFRVAKMSENDRVFDVIIHSMLDILRERGDFANAIRVASEIRDSEDREATEETLFVNAIEYYSDNHKYNGAVALINEIEKITTFDKPKDECIKKAFELLSQRKDTAGIIFLSHTFPDSGFEMDGIMSVEPDDPGVRSVQSVVYPMLTAEQKRSYHSKSVAVFNSDVLEIKNGRLTVGNSTYKDAVSVDTDINYTLILHSSGSVSLVPNTSSVYAYTIPAYTDVIAIAQGESHSVLLHSDGTVTVHGSNAYGQANVSGWSDIIAIAAGQRFTLGLKADGTAVAVGSNSAGQCDVSAYRNIVSVAACSQTSVLLFSDGTVKLEGYRSLGLSDIESISDVTRIRADGVTVVAEIDSKKYVSCSGNDGGNCGNPYNWQNIKAFDAGLMCIVGVDSDGNIYVDGDGIGG